MQTAMAAAGGISRHCDPAWRRFKKRCIPRGAVTFSAQPPWKKNNLIKFRRRKRPRNVAIERTGAPMDPSILPIFASGADFCCVTVCVCACVFVFVCGPVCVLILLGRRVPPDNCLLKSFLTHTHTHTLAELLSDFRPLFVLLLLLLQF